jgi:hypothetical protein
MIQSVANKNVNTEDEESTVLGAITKRRQVKTQRTEKTFVHAVLNYRACELVIAL